MGQAEARLISPHMANPHYLSSIYRLIVLMFGTQCPKGSGHRLQFLALGCQRISPIFQLTSPTLQFLGSLASASGSPSRISRWNQRAAAIQLGQVGDNKGITRCCPISWLNAVLISSTPERS